MGQRDPGPGQLGRDAERVRPEQGQRHAGLGDGRMTEAEEQDVHLPGLRATRGPAAPAGRAAARVLRPGGAQRADRPPGAAAPRERVRAHARPRRSDDRRLERPRGDAAMADEAYRAVFLRVHPTGKMVLSLTTEPDGNEGRYAQLVARRARGPGARRQGRSRGHRPVRRRPRLQHEPERRRRGGDRQRGGQDPRQGAAARGRRRWTRRRTASTGTTERGSPRTGATPRRSRRRGDRALRARLGRPAAGGRGRARRADRLHATDRPLRAPCHGVRT